MEVISDVKTLPCEHYCFGHWPFYKFQYSFWLGRCLVFLWYLFTRHDGNIMETVRHQDLNFVLTWNLFLFHTQVGCYFLADAFRLIHIKFTPCLELSRGGQGNNNDNKKGRREKWDASVFLFLFFDAEMESLGVSLSKHWHEFSRLLGELHLVVLFPHGY